VADLPTGLEIASVERDLAELRETLQAIDRLKTKDYGICPDCRGTIALSRLRANPAARRCVTCQERAEDARGGARPSSL
jgi:DnaK suppressor protein